MKDRMEFPAQSIRGLFTDLDGTLTDKGPLTVKTYEALWSLREKGLWLVIVSGRPAGWADSLMRLWPVDAVIFENGAGMLVHNQGKIEMMGLASHTDLQEKKQKLQKIFVRLKALIPHLKLASDQPYRMFDYAIDFGEDPPYLSEKEIKIVLDELSTEKGITFKLSSIHVNYWVGTHTKVTACSHLINTMGKSRGISKNEIVFCGDSPNDEPLFEFFDHSAGVANIKKFKSHLKSMPKLILEKPNGSGFQELAKLLLSV